MNFTGRIPNLTFDKDAYLAALKQSMQDQIKQAIVVYVNTILQRIPDWSGASVSTLATLGQAAGVNVALGGGSGVELVGDRSAEGVAATHSSTNMVGPVYSFTYSTSLPWLVWNNLNDANENPDPTKWRHKPGQPPMLHNPGPYELEALGWAAFSHYAWTLPDPSPFFKG
jgi:hypothetical protein